MSTGIAQIVLPLCVFGVVVIIIRAIGAWMHRINDVISLQKEILAELKKSNVENDS